MGDWQMAAAAPVQGALLTLPGRSPVTGAQQPVVAAPVVPGAVTLGGSPVTRAQLLARKSVLKRQLLADGPLLQRLSPSSPGGRARLAAYRAMKAEYKEIKALLEVAH